MEISNSYSGLIKQNTNNSCIYFQDKALSSYIYIKNYQKISLGKQELEKDFLRSVLSQDKIISLKVPRKKLLGRINYVLSVENNNKEMKAYKEWLLKFK